MKELKIGASDESLKTNWKAILCVLGAILINLTLGTFYSIGNVMPYVASYMRNNGHPGITTEHSVYVTSVFLLGQGVFLLVGSYVEKKFDSRIACILGCVIHSISTFLTITAIKTSFFLVVLIYGLGSGFGCGASYIASIIAAQKWFPNRKGLFTGVIVAGFGFGGLIFTSLQTLYMNPNNKPADASGMYSKEIYEKTPALFGYMGAAFVIMQTAGCLMAFPGPEPPSDEISSNEASTIVQDYVLPEMTNLSIAFNSRLFYIIGAMMMLVAPGVTFVNSLDKKYGQIFINDDKFLATVISLAAVANALGRLTWGFLMDHFPFSVCYTIKVVLFSTLILLFPIDFVLNSKAMFIIFTLGLFFGFSGTFVLFPVFVEQVFGSKYHGKIYGILYIALAISSIATSFILQSNVTPALSDIDQAQKAGLSRWWPCLLIAILYIASLLLYLLMNPVRRLENAIHRRMQIADQKKKNTLYHRQDLFPQETGTLAEKTSSSRPRKENSLGSIVRFNSSPSDQRQKIREFSVTKK